MVPQAANNPALPLDEMAALATGRAADLFGEDLRQHAGEIGQSVRGKRILVLGGAGSIGASTVDLLSGFAPAALHVVDQNENALAELVRDLRSRPDGLAVSDFLTVPLDLGSLLMKRFLRGQRGYDLVFNFAAIKHVRSEKDSCSVLQMFDTNLLKPLRCWEWICNIGKPSAYFSVSTDKAAEPVNLMGASKRLMEHLMFSGVGFAGAARMSSARFANVAFSQGSLLESFVRRLEKRQPLAAPRDTRRFFISLREAGQICVLAALCGPDRHIVIPRLDAQKDSHRLEEIAAAFLRWKGLEPALYTDEDTARHSVQKDLLRNRYPLLLTALDTAGEKEAEVFAGGGEESVEFGMQRLLALRYRPVDRALLADFLREVELLVLNPDAPAGKNDLAAAVAQVVPEFEHLDRVLSLDQRM